MKKVSNQMSTTLSYNKYTKVSHTLVSINKNGHVSWTKSDNLNEWFPWNFPKDLFFFFNVAICSQFLDTKRVQNCIFTRFEFHFDEMRIILSLAPFLSQPLQLNWNKKKLMLKQIIIIARWFDSENWTNNLKKA